MTAKWWAPLVWIPLTLAILAAGAYVALMPYLGGF